MNKDLLVVDAGSTKADWAYSTSTDTEPLTVSTDGFNPYTHSVEHLVTQLRILQSKFSSQAVLDIFYYGAGISESNQQVVSSACQKVFPNCQIEVASDLLGAARSVSQSNQGIVCISGTGSNACTYNGQIILQKINTLGYVLGDEGSGNHLGKELLRTYFYNQIPSGFKGKIYAVLSRIYPN